jgi:MFS family permease
VLVGLSPGIMMALLPRTVRAEHLATALGIFYALFYLGMAVSQTAAGFVRDLTGDPAMPLLFAALLMVATIPAVALFWRLEAQV